MPGCSAAAELASLAHILQAHGAYHHVQHMKTLRVRVLSPRKTS